MYISIFYLAMFAAFVSSIVGLLLYHFFTKSTKLSMLIRYGVGALFTVVVCFLLKDALYFGGNMYWLIATCLFSVVGYSCFLALYKKAVL